ncbi:hypothetical protein BDV93DRAFT_458972 [Ceratobasidium sp. AG-I]|nr:hypothetical protein BDV93DRAFT_458972 [Ceratobasidium sp. AG-I]
MRTAGTLITRAVATSVTLAFIRTYAPELFHDPRFKCSEGFIRRLLKHVLSWSWRATTQTAQKLPDDWEQRCIDLAHRLTWNIALHSVPPELLINADQTGVSYLGTGNKTWELKGAKQVPAIGQGEKRQFTLMVAVTAAGDTLPFQSIFKGSTSVSLPSKAFRRSSEAVGFVFTPGGEKHWSTLDCMKIWVIEIIVPYIEKTRASLRLPSTQRAILLLDCWSVHRGGPFCDWLKKTYPFILLQFVPGGCKT